MNEDVIIATSTDVHGIIWHVSLGSTGPEAA